MIRNHVFVDDLTGATLLQVNSKKHGGFVVWIDAANADAVAARQWSVMKKKGKTQVYFGTRATQSDTNKSTVQLHRFLGKCPNDLQVDHEKSEWLDARKDSLRCVNNTQNQQNRSKQRTFAGQPPSSGYKGVFRSKPDNKWCAKIRNNGKLIHIGYFPATPEGEIEAARAYDRAAQEHFGEFAKTNFTAKSPAARFLDRITQERGRTMAP